MTREEANELKPGVYKLYWQVKPTIDYSLAAVGLNHQGDAWYAPCNWLVVPSYDWHRVKMVELIETKKRIGTFPGPSTNINANINT